MRRDALVLRILIVLLLAGVVACAWMLYDMSGWVASELPEQAQWQMPVYVGCLVALGIVVVALVDTLAFLPVLDAGEVFSARTLRLLTRMRWYIGGFAAYITVGIGATMLLIPAGGPAVLFAWLALLVASLFLFTVVAHLRRMVAEAVELRTDAELTV